uniref:class I SAM-dependent methyltransferase n=1 Tax=Methylobacterium sp. B34 TaxID=95563 RepID=UPI0009FFB41F|nr:class I SAM-dependent methyltransferase [Methylobacterium sp. B34]
MQEIKGLGAHDMTKEPDQTCTVCQAENFSCMGTRIDGRKVMSCNHCGMGVIEKIPADLSIFYEDGYYGDQAGPTLGYINDYSKMSFHTTAWASSFAKLLKPSGKVLDIGCVDGFLLEQLGSGFVKYGIEMNARMSLRAQERGINIIGPDILNRELILAHAGKFDLITAIAVFEHLPNIRQGLKNSLDLLAEDGIILFEIPLISEQNDNAVWFNSSLEHVFYPTSKSIRYLVEDELKYKLIGSEIYIQGYASTYCGIVCKCASDNERIAAIFDRILSNSKDLQSEEEYVARAHLKLIHAADSALDLIANLHRIPSKDLELALINRIQQIWARDLTDLRNAQISLEKAILDHRAIEEARDFWHDQAGRWELAHNNLLEAYSAVEKARDFWHAEADKWEAETRGTHDVEK